MHEPVAPIVNFVGLRVGVNVHVPFFDQVFTPGEFVETTAPNFVTSLGARVETFQVTFVGVAADTDLLTATPAKTPIASNTPPVLRTENLGRESVIIGQS